ncbi:ABC-2 type transport system permease protein [Leifsonia sp. 98AMF]|uniref:ABC transporter permease n=1 Tax=unclassified Leifsonia TaxID=2663824 RepID=UPI00087A4DB4|nr:MULTISPECIES: ABC transporter permease [unclassified Leifsonia]SDH47685.1 ABC-2 type transport system permease protein [Leifsonia sp. 197AMF]SDI89879.1 ABC-2 type transport system permease protein [Leifsonia sp. 466MF]SDJ90639.1 ABC-2 type transport system permease protein [Leifsonia sp. 157MF]SDN93572.1 ABC-2 type transport system permease protein [Leifsonia sp. 509MF]SEN12131.1 ABC-2 type transport system permease protein [Leifsonia sp. 467MF]
MNPTRTLATTGRVLTQIRHDPRTVVLLLVVPALLVGLVAWIFTDTPVFQTIGPAILALFPFIVMFLVTSITTLRERRTGTLERLLSMPLGRSDFILGYTLAFGLLAVVQALIASAYALWVCGLDVKGDPWLLVAVAVTDAVLGSTLGLFASAFARTEFQVVQFMPLLVFPQILLGGIFLPRDQLPAGLEEISDWLPLSHAVDALNAVATNSHDAAYVGGQLLIIGAFAVAAVVFGALTLQRRTA